jgi:hypothetical protein
MVGYQDDHPAVIGGGVDITARWRKFPGKKRSRHSVDPLVRSAQIDASTSSKISRRSF